MPKSTWRSIADAIGPLRYQSSESDCVPTTVINGLLVLYRRQIPAALVKLVWTVGVDFDEGTGYVGTRTLAALLDAWFKMAYLDTREATPIALSSRIIERRDVYLGPDSQIDKTLANGGVCCLTVQKGCHYALLLGMDTQSHYLLFDPGWDGALGKKAHQTEFEKYHGLVNRRLSEAQLNNELRHRYNKYVHLLEHEQT